MTTNCSKCDCPQKDCGCNDTSLTTNYLCNTAAPTCPNPEPCPETFSDCCVIHNGDAFTYVNPLANPPAQFIIHQGERLCDTWQRFFTYYNCPNGSENTVYGLKSKNITSTTLTVAWTPLSLASTDYYEVFYCPVAGPITFISAGTVAYNNTTPSLTITGLTPNTSYYVNVKVVMLAANTCSSVSLILTTKLT